jgi:aminoglycoside phosphotransferase (APT) family kinase protein
MSHLTREELAAVRAQLIAHHVDVTGDLDATLIAGGRSNLTFKVSDDSHHWALRMPPRLGRTQSAHDVGREFRVTRALSRTSVPVPMPVLLASEDVIGLPFAMSEFVDGQTIQTQEQLRELTDDQVQGCVDALIETLAALHAVDYHAVGLDDAPPGTYAERQLRRWARQWQKVGTPDLQAPASELRRELAAGLSSVTQEATSIVHGDYRIDNTLLEIGDAVRVRAVVDWELSTIGDPVADVALMCVYRHPALDLILGGASAWTSSRLPDPSAMAARYEKAGGTALEHWHFHLALGYYKLAVIAAGIAYRFRAGATTDAGHAQAGEAVLPLLESGLDALRDR